MSVLDTLITVLDTLITVSFSRLPLASGVSFFTRKTPASVFLVLAMPLRSEKGTTWNDLHTLTSQGTMQGRNLGVAPLCRRCSTAALG